MPIEINYGATDRVGPGFLITLRTDLPGPWPADTRWNIQIAENAEDTGGATLWDQAIPNPNALLTGTLGKYEGEWHPLAGQAWFVDGADVFMQVKLIAAGSVNDSVTIPVRLDMVTGTQSVVIDTAASSGTGGGLTPLQAEQLTQVQMATGLQIGGGITEAVLDLLDVVGRRFFGSELIPPDREGEGYLTRPGALGEVNAFGLAWQAVFWPEGIGLDDGNPDLLEIDYLNLAQLQDRGGAGLVVKDARFVRLVNGEMLWMLDTPDAIGYWIAPGVRVRFWWLVLFGGTAAALEASSSSPTTTESVVS